MINVRGILRQDGVDIVCSSPVLFDRFTRGGVVFRGITFSMSKVKELLMYEPETPCLLGNVLWYDGYE